MRLKTFILLLLFVSLVLASPLLAARLDTALSKAKDSYAALQSSPRKQKLRSEWDRVMLQFLQVYERDPTGPYAGEALFMAARTVHGRYRISRVPDDAWEAVALFERVPRDAPESTLGDDALVLAGELLEKTLGAPEEAYLRYQQAVSTYPHGDMSQRARQRLNALVRYAPPPPAVVAAAPASVAAPVLPSSELPAGTGTSRLSGIRFWSNPGYTRVVLDVTETSSYTTNFLNADPVENLPPRLFLDIGPATLDAVLKAPTVVDDGLLRRIRTGVPEAGKVRVVLDLVSIGQYKVFPLYDPFRLVIDISGDSAPEIKAPEPSLQAAASSKSDEVAKVLEQLPAPPQPPSLPPPPSLTGLRRIVVDAGHGGKDPGAIGPSGVREKDITLSLARKLAGQLRETLGCEVVLTRDRDIFLPLEERTAIANKVGADLFISVHANAATNRQAYGIETYYLNFSKNDKAAAVAARENGTSLKEVTDLEQILFDLMANSKINESSLLAAEIQKSLVDRLGERFEEVRDLGVRQGPFYVLLGATMPSVLVEAAFISHPREEQRLVSRSYQEHTAHAIAEAVKSYARAHKLIASR
jgi:N-acetylmuramoyl-L-alanine amidase